MALQLLPPIVIAWILPLRLIVLWGSEESRGENSLGILLRSEIPWISYLCCPGKELIRERKGPQRTLHCPLLPEASAPLQCGQPPLHTLHPGSELRLYAGPIVSLVSWIKV